MEKFAMTPETGERAVRFVGDRLAFSLRQAGGKALPEGWRALLRTNLGRGEVLRREIIQAYPDRFRLPNSSWRDIPMERRANAWHRELALTEAGYFRAKAYAV